MNANAIEYPQARTFLNDNFIIVKSLDQRQEANCFHFIGNESFKDKKLVEGDICSHDEMRTAPTINFTNNKP